MHIAQSQKIIMVIARSTGSVVVPKYRGGGGRLAAGPRWRVPVVLMVRARSVYSQPNRIPKCSVYIKPGNQS